METTPPEGPTAAPSTATPSGSAGDSEPLRKASGIRRFADYILVALSFASVVGTLALATYQSPATTLAGVFTAVVLACLAVATKRARQHRAETAKADIEASERRTFSDLSPAGRELMVHLLNRYQDSGGRYDGSLRSSPALFFAGLACAIFSISVLGAGVVNVWWSAKAVPIESLVENGTTAILLGVMATGFFGQRRYILRHSLTFFQDMVHTRNIQTVVRMLASTKGWDDLDLKTYLRLAQLVAKREVVIPADEKAPKDLAPNVAGLVEKVADAMKDIVRDMAKEAVKRKSPPTPSAD